MKKLLLLAILIGFVSCNEDVVSKPDNLIPRDKMIDVMYDLSILDAVKYQIPVSAVAYEINPSKYIYKKFKIDSLQFAQSNIYYASDYTDYKDMYDEVIKRIESKKTVLDSLLIKQDKKIAKAKADSIKKSKPLLMKIDSLELKQMQIARKKRLDGMKNK